MATEAARAASPTPRRIHDVSVVTYCQLKDECVNLSPYPLILIIISQQTRSLIHRQLLRVMLALVHSCARGVFSLPSTHSSVHYSTIVHPIVRGGTSRILALTHPSHPLLALHYTAQPVHFIQFTIDSTISSPQRLTFMWWGRYGLHQRHKPTDLAHSFFLILFLCLFFLFVALSTVFCSINSPYNSPYSHSLLPVLFLPCWSFQLYISL